MRVVRDGGRERAVERAEPFQKAEPDIPRAAVTLDDGELQKVCAAQRDVLPFRPNGAHRPARDQAAPLHADDVGAFPPQAQAEAVGRDVVQVDGAAHRLRQIPLGRGEQRGSSFCHGNTRLEGIGAAEVVQVVKDGDIRVVPRRDGALPLQLIALRGVAGGGDDRPDGVHALPHGDAQRVVDMPVRADVRGVAVVRAEEEAPQVGSRDGAAVLGDVTRRRPLAQVDVQAFGGLFLRLRRAGALVVGGDARGDVGVQALPLRAGGVAVDDLAEGAGRGDLLHGFGVLADHPGEVHELAETEEGVLAQQLRRLRRGEGGAARFKGGGGHAGREHEMHFERGIGSGAGDVARARNAAHVDDLVRVGDDGRRAAGHDQPRELPRRELGALDMDVRVDKPGDGDLAADVVLLFALVDADAGDLAARDGDVAVQHFAREYVDIAAVFQDGVRLPPAEGDVDQIFAHGAFLPL